MTPVDSPADARSGRREWAFVAAMTALGLGVRVVGLGRLGLVHFDEGIYAIAGLWPLRPGGWDPLSIPYAPAGFPFLVGLSYLVFGPGDGAAILVSIATGTMAIPATAWLARRTFGGGAGAAASALAALSGFHVAFSRMALTDATYALAWIVGLIAARRFLESPGPVRALILGLATGLAQWVKYSGWTVGAAVALAAAAIVVLDPARRDLAYQRRVWGWGMLAAVVAALVYAPWYVFVENHGGYSGLMAHHRGYLGTFATWLPHWATQLEQASVLAGGPLWRGAAWGLAVAGAAAAGRRARPSPLGLAGLAAMTAAALVAPTMGWWIGLACLACAGKAASPGLRLLGAAWVGLSILTPFYHPYARLWIPLQTLGWVAAAGAVASLLDARLDPRGWLRWNRIPMLVGCCIAATSQAVILAMTSGPSSGRPGLLAPSDSLRVAATRAAADLPERVAVLRVLARPPVLFHLGGRVEVRREPDAEALLARVDDAWALVDVAQLRQSGGVAGLGAGLLERWEKVAEYPSTLNLPTLLDVDPGAAIDAPPGVADAPLWLLRPRPGGPR